MGATDAEAPAAQVALGDEGEASVGVLGWLGFIIINIAAWGIIGVSTGIGWVLGLIICVCYTLGLIGLAVFFEGRDPVKFNRFLNLLWVLAATFVFVTGMFVAVQIIGPLGNSSSNDAGTNGTDASPSPSPEDPGSLSSLLPDNASTALREWTEKGSWEAFKPDHAVFGGSLFFNGKDESLGRSVLLRSAGGNGSTMTPTVLDGEGFVEYQSGLYFYDAGDLGSSLPVLRVDAGDLDTAVVAVTVATTTIWGLFVEDSALYIRARYSCSCLYIDTLFRSDGTDAGTVDLRGDQCSTSCGGGTVPIDPSDNFNRASLWGALLVAVLPMMVLAGVVLVKKQLPGLFVNLYLGVEAAVIIVYFLVTFGTQNGEAHFTEFLKWFLTAYNSLLWVALAAWSLARVQLPNWEESRQEELKSWAVAFVGVSFFVMIHIVTEIPWNDGLGRWICYAVLTIVQIVLSAIVSRTVPMVTGAIGLFILSWKFAVELVEATGISDSEFATLVLLAIMALQGLAIIVGAIFYAGNREKIEGTVNALLRCDRAALRERGAQPFGDMAA